MGVWVAVVSSTSQPMMWGRVMVRCVTLLRAGEALVMNVLSRAASLVSPGSAQH